MRRNRNLAGEIGSSAKLDLSCQIGLVVKAAGTRDGNRADPFTFVIGIERYVCVCPVKDV